MEKLKHIGLLFLVILSLSVETFAQRINFSTWTGSEDILITAVGTGMNSLNFNDKQKVLLAGSPAVVIGKTDPQVAIFEIEAPSEYDITVELDFPFFLYKDGIPTGDQKFPLDLQMAYVNEATLGFEFLTGGSTALEVPPGFNSVTFPVNRRVSGAPMPPTPEYGGYTRPKSKVYVYVYGSVGPIGQNISAGDYLANVTLSVYVAGGQN